MNKDLFSVINESLMENSLSPKYMKLKQGMERAIRLRILANGAVLPSERKLAQALHLSRVTITKMLDELRKSGLVIKKQGKGTIVNYPLDYNLSGGGFSSQLQSQGKLSNRWLSRALIEGSEQIRQELEVDEASKVAKIKRVRLADEIPVSIETMFIPQEYLPRPAELEGSLYNYWSQQGVVPCTQEYEIKVHKLTQEEADMLDVEMHEAALKIRLKSLNENGCVLEYGYVICRSTSYNFKFKVQLL